MRNLYFISLLLLASCGSMQKGASPSFEMAGQEMAAPEFDHENRPPSSRQMVYDAYLNLKVKSADGIGGRVENMGKSMGGYVLHSGLDRVVIRVPADKLDEALAAIRQMGKVESQDVTGRDVTDQYADLSLRLDNAQKARERYLQLLEKAQAVTEILPIEKELERLQFDIENLKGQINRIDELIAFSTITVSIEEKVKPGPLGWVFVGIWKGLKFLFVWD